MIATDLDILYNACKHRVGFFRSQRFVDWFHQEYPDKELHHAFGSYSQTLKTTDYCSVPLDRVRHEQAEKDKSGQAIENYPLMLETMIAYIRHLEQQIERKEV